MKIYRLLLLTLYLISFAAIARVAADGTSYYTTALVERPRHELYWSLKPGGERGILYGVVGTAMMTLMLAYSLRKRVRWLRRWGPLEVWLDIHIYLGVFGSLLVVLHTSFKFGGIVSLSFWSMVVVASSGVVGRYLYLRLPRGKSVLTAAEKRVVRAFHYWHVFHKPLTLVMFLFLVVHVVVAWRMGYAQSIVNVAWWRS
jgi:hypothetical protein